MHWYYSLCIFLLISILRQFSLNWFDFFAYLHMMVSKRTFSALPCFVWYRFVRCFWGSLMISYHCHRNNRWSDPMWTGCLGIERDQHNFISGLYNFFGMGNGAALTIYLLIFISLEIGAWFPVLSNLHSAGEWKLFSYRRYRKFLTVLTDSNILENSFSPVISPPIIFVTELHNLS